MDYQALFKEKALEYFELNADDWYKPFSLDQFIYELELMCKNANDEYIPKRGKQRLLKIYDKYISICENPTALTEEDQIAIAEMKDYFRKNRGHSSGYFPYRKKFYEEEVGRYYEMSLSNKMNILANKDLILDEIQKKIVYMDQCEYENKYIKKRIFTPKMKENNKKWASKKALCVCGREYTRGNKTEHLNTKFHKKFIEDNKKCEPIVMDVGNITMTIEDS